MEGWLVRLMEDPDAYDGLERERLTGEVRFQWREVEVTGRGDSGRRFVDRHGSERTEPSEQG